MHNASVLFAGRDILATAALAALAASIAVWALPWVRKPSWALAGAVATLLGFSAWYLVLNATNGTGFNVDAPVIRLSWADAGSGWLAFIACSLALGLGVGRHQPAWQPVSAAAAAGLATTVVDLFLL